MALRANVKSAVPSSPKSICRRSGRPACRRRAMPSSPRVPFTISVPCRSFGRGPWSPWWRAEPATGFAGAASAGAATTAAVAATAPRTAAARSVGRTGQAPRGAFFRTRVLMVCWLLIGRDERFTGQGHRSAAVIPGFYAHGAGRPPRAAPSPMERPLDPARIGDHLDRLYRAAWALCGSREDAEDLVQETYARVLGRPRLLRRDDDLGYLLRTLRNTFLTQRRDQGRRLRPVPLPDDADLVPDPRAVQPHAALEAAELYAAIAALPGDYRDVIVAV